MEKKRIKVIFGWYGFGSNGLTVKAWFNGLLVQKKINALVWFGFSITGSGSARLGSKTRVYRFIGLV